MFDEHCPERRSVARNLVGQNFHMPAPKKLLELQLKVWGQRPWSTECRGLRCRFAVPPLDGCIDGIQGQGAERFLNVVCQAA